MTEQRLAFAPFCLWLEDAGAGGPATAGEAPALHSVHRCRLRLVFAVEAVAAFPFNRQGFDNFKKCAGSMGEIRIFAVDEAELAFELQFPHRDADEFAAGNFRFHADLGQKSDSVAHCDVLLDRLEGWEFEIHVQRSFMRLEKLDHLFPIRRGHDVSDKRLCS